MKVGRFIAWPRRRFPGGWKVWPLIAAAAGLAVAVNVFILDRPDPADWARARAGETQWSIMTYNIQLGGQPAGAALDAIAAANPDVVCLQELTPQLAESFKMRLGRRYPHRYFKPGRMTQGVGIASRYPLVGGRVLTLGLTYLPAVSATVGLKSGAIRVACVHLMPPFARFRKSVNVWKRYVRNEVIRVGQARRLLKHLDAFQLPTIILGDLNEWPGQAAMAELAAAGFTDACVGSGADCGPTWPGYTLSFPTLFRVDHILGRGVSFTDAAVLEAGGSDHYPVVARVRLEGHPAALAGQ